MSYPSAETRVTGQMAGGKKFGVGRVSGLEDLAKQIFLDIYEAISLQYPPPHRQLNVLVLEDMYHKNHVMSSKACFGREDLLQTMMALLGRIFRILNTGYIDVYV
jgi:hypothetical protein